jgi:hypothetical protein
MEKFKNKSEAKKAVIGKGYTVHSSTGSSGDYAHGSREYFHKPDSKLNDYGMPLQHATISKVGSDWYLSEFGKGE